MLILHGIKTGHSNTSRDVWQYITQKNLLLCQTGCFTKQSHFCNRPHFLSACGGLSFALSGLWIPAFAGMTRGLTPPAMRSYGPSGLIKKWCDFIGTLLKNPRLTAGAIKSDGMGFSPCYKTRFFWCSGVIAVRAVP